MLKRKATKQLETWLKTKGKQALLVTGARQVGKTYLIRDFAAAHWKNVIEINFFENTEARMAIETATNSSELFMRIAAFANVPLIPNKTVIFLDEVQECKEVVTFIKFLMERGEYDYILSGSMLGTELKGISSAPVGYLNTIVMFPLDFEEFCLANNVAPELIDAARDSFSNRSKLDDYLHNKFIDLFHRYLICGGMPDAVNAFISSDDVSAARTAQEAIVGQYRWDISKYAASRARVVRRIFDLMPSEISMQDKRFVVRDVEGDSHFDRYDNDFMWLADANVALPTYNVREPRYPLATSAEIPKFKLFSSDVGILTYQCGMNVVRGILGSRPDINFGAIYENAVAQELKAHGHGLYYFKNRNLGEIDFVVQTEDGHVVPVEVKSGKDYKRHSALNNVLKTKNYGIEEAFVLCEDNVSSGGKVTYLPIYMAAFI
jgi:uncharacterized protein